MTNTNRNRIGSEPTSRDVRFGVRFACLGLTLLAWPISARAVEPATGPLLSPPSKLSAARDIEVEVRIRAALWKDDTLRRLNLGVKMTNGIAHLSGPVPSVEMRKRAVHIVEQITGVVEVRTAQVYIAKGRDPVKPLALPLESDKPTRTRSASVNAGAFAPSTLTGRELSAPPIPQRVTLLAPEAVATPARAPEPARSTVNPRPPASVDSLSARIDRLRQRDERFRKIRTEVIGSTVRIHTGDASGEQVMRFAQSIARLPGVERVVVLDASGRR